MGRRPVACAMVALFLGAGCLVPGAVTPAAVPPGGRDGFPASVQAGLDLLAARRQEPLALDGEVVVDVVLVGIDPDLVDADAMRAALPADYSPRIDYSVPRGEGMRSGIMHRIRYEVHAAPDAFADALFAQYPAFSREADLPGGESGFLARYDAMYELGRAASGKVRLVDARKVEDWIEASRDAHGLRFEGPRSTIFFLDSWTKHKLWADGYYWYEFNGDMTPTAASFDMRAWGGTHGFLFMDWSAAPNDEDMDNGGVTKADALESLSVPVTAPEGTAYNDPPSWHYDGATAAIGKGPLEKRVALTDRIAHAVEAAVDLRIFGDFAFRPTYADRYHVNVLLWHDGRSSIPAEGLDGLLDPETLRQGLQDEVPWAEVAVSFKAYVAPRDDPAMDRVIQRAKAEGAGTTLAMAPIFNHVDANPGQYRQGGPGAVDVMALLFLLEGHYGVFLPGGAGGVAVSGPDGTCWGTISNVNDVFYAHNGRSVGVVARHMTRVNAHEVGHCFGLMHAHNGYRRTPEGYVAWLDHTWSTTNTVMSYRVSPPTSDAFGRDILARAHALDSLEATLRNAHSAYRALHASGAAEAPEPVRARLSDAAAGFNDALRAYHEGEYRGAVEAAIRGRRASDEAMALAGVVEREEVVEAWSAQGVSHGGAKNTLLVWRPSVSPGGPLFDYRPVPLSDDVERVTVRARWTNAPASWGDFFVGWRVGDFGLVNAGPVPMGSVVSFEGGIHDEADEGPLDGAVERSFTLDLDAFPSLRAAGEIHAGAGTQGMAVNGAYEVEVVLAYRDHGDADTLPGQG